MRPPRLALLLGALVVPVLPVLAAAPAQAVGTTIICVNRPDDRDCTVEPATIPLAIQVAATDGADSVIRIGPGVYTDGPYDFDGTTSSLVVQGSNNGTGDNATLLQGGTAAPYVTAQSATVRNVRVSLSGAGGVGVALSGNNAIAQNVIVADAPGALATGATGVRVVGVGVKAQNTTVNLFRGAGNIGFQVTDGALSRVTARASDTGISVEGGSVGLDNSLIELDTAGSAGLRAGTATSTTDVAVDAKHLTVVGAATESRGVWAFADAVGRSSTVTLANSIVRGPTYALAATGTDGTANVGVFYSDFSPQAVQEDGVGVVDQSGDGNLDVDPGFLDPASDDYELRSGSLVVDKASNTLAVGTDRDDLPRAFDGDGNGSVLPDMGAYELSDITAPTTTITSGPSGATNDTTPIFTFAANDAPATFECQLDGGAFQACSSPVTTTVLPDGAHSLGVRAKDRLGNVEATPATRTYTVDTRVPQTTITKKPQKRFFKQRVKFKYVSDEVGARFQCQLDNLPWRNCASPFRYNVKVGKHRLLVRAVDAAGNTDATPARYKFKRIARPKPHHHR